MMSWIHLFSLYFWLTEKPQLPIPKSQAKSTGWWLSPTPLKHDGVSNSWDVIPFPILTVCKICKVIQNSHGSSHHQPDLLFPQSTSSHPWPPIPGLRARGQRLVCPWRTRASGTDRGGRARCWCPLPRKLPFFKRRSSKLPSGELTVCYWKWP